MSCFEPVSLVFRHSPKKYSFEHPVSKLAPKKKLFGNNIGNNSHGFRVKLFTDSLKLAHAGKRREFRKERKW